MRAALLFHEKVVKENGAIIEVKIWKVPLSKGNPEGLKYSLVYIVGGERIIGYDNSEGKGHHRHYRDKETAYRFTSVDRLFSDFAKDIEEVEG